MAIENFVQILCSIYAYSKYSPEYNLQYLKHCCVLRNVKYSYHVLKLEHSYQCCEIWQAINNNSVFNVFQIHCGRLLAFHLKRVSMHFSSHWICCCQILTALLKPSSLPAKIYKTIQKTGQ